MNRWTLVAGCLLVLSACAVRSPHDVPLAPPLRSLPWAATADGGTVRIESALTASFPAARVQPPLQMLVVLERQADALQLVALSPAGIPLFSLSLQADGSLLTRPMAMTTRPMATTTELDPQRILADLQLCLWPLALLRAQLPEGFSVRQGERTRTLLYRGQPMIDVAYGGTVSDRFVANAGLPVILEHRLLGYRIAVRPLSEPTEDE